MLLCQPKLAQPEAVVPVLVGTAQFAGAIWKYGGNKRNTNLRIDRELLTSEPVFVSPYIPLSEDSTARRHEETVFHHHTAYTSTEVVS